MSRLATALCFTLLLVGGAIAQAGSPSELAWRIVRNSADARTLEDFIAQFPDSSHVEEAQAKILALLEPGESLDSGGDMMEAPVAAVPAAELPRRVQRGLRLAGCNAGIVSDVWGNRAEEAMTRYAQRSGSRLPDGPSYDLLTQLEGRFPVDCGNSFVTAVDPRAIGRLSLEATWNEEQVTRSGGGKGSKQRTRYIYRADIEAGLVEDSMTVGISSPRKRRFSGTLGEPGIDSNGDLVSWSYDGTRLVRVRDRESYWTKTYFLFYRESGKLSCRMDVVVELKPGFDRVIAQAQSSGAALEVLDVTPVSSVCDVSG